jgi:hypothetical protein
MRAACHGTACFAHHVAHDHEQPFIAVADESVLPVD